MTKELLNNAQMTWKVNTGGLLKEIMSNNGTGVLLRPLQIFAGILASVAERSNELRDPVLDKLMCELALYEQSDPYSKEYDKDMIDQVYENFKEYVENLNKN